MTYGQPALADGDAPLPWTLRLIRQERFLEFARALRSQLRQQR